MGNLAVTGSQNSLKNDSHLVGNQPHSLIVGPNSLSRLQGVGKGEERRAVNDASSTIHQLQSSSVFSSIAAPLMMGVFAFAASAGGQTSFLGSFVKYVLITSAVGFALSWVIRAHFRGAIGMAPRSQAAIGVPVLSTILYFLPDAGFGVAISFAIGGVAALFPKFSKKK